MIADQLLRIANSTALNTGAAGNYVVGTGVFVGPGGRNLGVHKSPVTAVITVNTAVDSAGDGVTLQFSLLTDAVAAMTTAPKVVVATPVLTQAQLIAGAQFLLRLPSTMIYEEYIGLRQTTAVEAVTAGAITVDFTMNPREWNAYPAETGY